jgi:hypothetical protein
MANKKETAKKTTTTTKKSPVKKTPVKRPTASQKLKDANGEIESLKATVYKQAGELETSARLLHNAVVNANNANRKLTEEQALRDQFFSDVDNLVSNYKKSNFFTRLINGVKVLNSLIRMFKYYKQAINEKG